MSIKVLKPGLSTSVQDCGREGYYHLGIPPSGALDQYSLKAANLLVGNPANSAALECTLLGPTLEFQQDALVAITGARMQPRLDGDEVPLDTAFKVKAGQTLDLSFALLGSRCYLAVAGGIKVANVLGSYSTYALGGLGGFEGRKLAAGDILPLDPLASTEREGTSLPAHLLRPLQKEVELRVVPGLYYHRLTEEAAQNFFDDTWTVASEADRTGYRYKGGRPLKFTPREQPFGAGSDPSNIVDACYPIGSIQVPGGSEPIILHRDAVSGGGYAMIGTVISSDLDLVGQLQPNNRSRFVAVTLEQALQARQAYQQQFEQLERALSN